MAAGGIALGLATLTRPAVIYYAPAMVAFFAWRALHRPVSERPQEWRLAALHGLAFALVAVWIARNAVSFGFPAVATGAGAALFFGVNPLVDGFDPQYFGMNYDTGGVHPDLTHLSIDSDRILRAVAAIQFFDTPLPVLLGMFARKTAAFIFVTTAETSGESILLQREWRILLVAGAAAAFAFHRRSILVATLGALVLYMLVAHMPALYHHRYSVGALDLPLSLLAAIGFVEALKSVARTLPALAIAGLALVAGYVDASVTGPHAPKPERIPHLIRWQSEVKLARRLEPGQAVVEIAIPKEAGTPPWDLSLLQLVLSVAPETRGAGCASFWLQFRGEEEAAYNPGRAVRIAVPAGSRPRTLNIGTTVPLVLDRAGTVRLTFDCRGPATLSIASAAVISPTRHLHYRDLYLERQAGS